MSTNFDSEARKGENAECQLRAAEANEARQLAVVQPSAGSNGESGVHSCNPDSSAACAANPSESFPVFRVTRFNPRRMARAVEAVEVEVQWEDGVERLWMSERDIRANISEFGTSQGLTDALACYRTRSLVKTLPNRVIP